MVANEAPDNESFCVSLNEAPAGAGNLRFYGGFSIQSTGDPSRGPPGSCGLSVDLLGNIQAALIPLSPLLTVIDSVATLGHCLKTLIEAQTNPLKLLEAIKCIPEIIAKVNKLLALVPIFPQGILQMLEMCLDILNFILTQLDCLVSVLTSIQAQIDELSRLAERINETDDDIIVANLQELIDCGTANAQTQANSAMEAFGPLARLICEVRFMISTIPQARPIANLIGIPDPGSLVDLSGAIAVVTVARDVVQIAVQAIVILGAAFGLQLPNPSFSCPPQPPPLPDEEVPFPVITALTDLNDVALLSIPAALSSAEPDFQFKVYGTDFRENSNVLFGAEQLPDEKATFDSGYGFMLVSLPATLRLTPSPPDYQVSVVNKPAGGLLPFDGLPSFLGANDAESDIKTSDPFDIAVV